MKLLVQADDYGFTKGVTLGIIDGIKNGFLRNTGMFMNMPEAVHAATLIPSCPEACFGMDCNLVSGPSVSDPKTIPSLVDENGDFIRSNIRMADPRWATEEGREAMFPIEEVRRELRAQYNRFVELVGRKPGYLHGHSIVTDSIRKVMDELAGENSIILSGEARAKSFDVMTWGGGGLSPSKAFDPAAQVKKDPEGIFWNNRDEALKHDFVMTIGHCGFVDAALFDLTSLSIERARDHQMITSKRIMQWIKENDVQLITYYDLV